MPESAGGTGIPRSHRAAELATPGADLASRVVTALTCRHLTLATCESLTAGLVSARVADVPGASAVLRGGLVTYSSQLKVDLVGVDRQWVAEHGVVNATTARHMASAVTGICGADLGVGCTGVAGPDSQDGVAPGTVHVAVARAGRPWHQACAEVLTLSGDRGHIREATVQACLDLVLRVVNTM